MLFTENPTPRKLNLKIFAIKKNLRSSFYKNVLGHIIKKVSLTAKQCFSSALIVHLLLRSSSSFSTFFFKNRNKFHIDRKKIGAKGFQIESSQSMSIGSNVFSNLATFYSTHRRLFFLIIFKLPFTFRPKTHSYTFFFVNSSSLLHSTRSYHFKTF